MFKIAYVGKIIDIQPIKGADFIVSATVICGQGGKWIGTVKKDQFNIGDIVEVYLQDALLPKTEEFAFMKQHKYRVSMRKFKKVPSECLIMPFTLQGKNFGVGDDIADIKDIKKYSKPVPASLGGQVLGSFPTNLIPKTDEPNFQTVPDMVEKLKGEYFYSTVKADGSSGTIYRCDNHFGCCSRNLELKDDNKTVVWRIAKKYNLEDEKVLPNNFAIQFEMVGPGIQKNRLGLEKIDMRIFNLWYIDKRRYADAEEMFAFCYDRKFPTVDIVDFNEKFKFESDDELRKYAEGKYESGYHREGVVIRPMIETRVNFERLSFKVINLNYKD